MEVESIRIKLPLNDPEYVYVYLLNSEVLIDAGFCSKDSAEELYENTKVDKVLLTHHHMDHTGLLFFKEVEAYLHPIEKELLGLYQSPEKFVKIYEKISTLYDFPEYYVRSFSLISSFRLDIKARLNVFGENVFGLEVIHTPGHTPGHVCFYRDKVLFGGDMVLSNTTTHIGYYPHYSGNPVGDHVGSLIKLSKLEIDVIYPAHEKPIKNPEKRIHDLLEHYLERANEVYSLLSTEPKKVVEIAKSIKWSTGDFEDLDYFNRMLALHETVAYLTHLKEQKKAKEVVVGGVVHFKKVS